MRAPWRSAGRKRLFGGNILAWHKTDGDRGPLDPHSFRRRFGKENARRDTAGLAAAPAELFRLVRLARQAQVRDAAIGQHIDHHALRRQAARDDRPMGEAGKQQQHGAEDAQ